MLPGFGLPNILFSRKRGRETFGVLGLIYTMLAIGV
jgi:hypothetical protein